MNRGKVAPYQCSEILMTFLDYIYVLLDIDYGDLQRCLTGLSKFFPFEVPHYTNIYRRISNLKLDLIWRKPY